MSLLSTKIEAEAKVLEAKPITQAESDISRIADAQAGIDRVREELRKLEAEMKASPTPHDPPLPKV